VAGGGLGRQGGECRRCDAFGRRGETAAAVTMGVVHQYLQTYRYGRISRREQV
jgi:hypothetical protein